MPVWRSHVRGIVATAVASALLCAGAVTAVSGRPGSTGTLALVEPPPAPSSSTPATPPARAGRSTPPAKRPALVDSARKVAERQATTIHAAAGEAYQARDVVVDPDGDRHVRFDRTWQGLAVLGGDFVVHSTGRGAFTGATVAQQAAIDVPRKPAVTQRLALTIARQQLAGDARARLVVDAFDGRPALAWEVTVADRLVVVVDATGPRPPSTCTTAWRRAGTTCSPRSAGPESAGTARV